MFIVKKDFSYPCMWDDIKLAGKKHKIDPMWKVLNKEVDLGEPTSFFDHEHLGCTQRQCEVSQDIVDNYRTMFESRISAGRLEKLPFPQNIRISSWSYDMVGHAKKCVERYCELANKTTQQLYKVSTPCIDDHHFKEEKNKICWRIVKYMLSNCSEMFIFGKNLRTDTVISTSSPCCRPFGAARRTPLQAELERERPRPQL